MQECTINTIRNFIKAMKQQEDGSPYDSGTWERYREYVFNFLVMYYKYNIDTLPFQYNGEELKWSIVMTDRQNNRRNKINVVYLLEPGTEYVPGFYVYSSVYFYDIVI